MSMSLLLLCDGERRHEALSSNTGVCSLDSMFFCSRLFSFFSDFFRQVATLFMHCNDALVGVESGQTNVLAYVYPGCIMCVCELVLRLSA